MSFFGVFKSRSRISAVGKSVCCFRPDPSTNFTILHNHNVSRSQNCRSCFLTMRVRITNKRHTRAQYPLILALYRANGMVIALRRAFRKSILQTAKNCHRVSETDSPAAYPFFVTIANNFHLIILDNRL